MLKRLLSLALGAFFTVGMTMGCGKSETPPPKPPENTQGEKTSYKCSKEGCDKTQEVAAADAAPSC